MFVPVRVFDTIFTAFTTFCIRIVQTAVYAKTAVFAKFNPVFVKAFVTLFTNDATFFAV